VSVDRFAVATDGTRLRIRVEGRAGARPILFSHSLGVTLDTWDAQVRALGDAWCVVRYDARGHGESDAPEGPYDLDMLGRDALAVLDAAGIERAHVVGLSMGGMVAMWLAVNAPERVDRLVLANTTTHIPLRDTWNQRIATARESGMAPIAAQTLDRWLGPAFKAAHPDARDAMVATMNAMSPVGYAGCCAALRDADQRETVGRIGAATLVLTGSADLATTPAVAQGLAAAIPSGRASVIDDAGHLCNVEQPEAFERHLRDFLA
jgi:3-oxoadipate enol-lactonase